MKKKAYVLLTARRRSSTGVATRLVTHKGMTSLRALQPHTQEELDPLLPSVLAKVEG